MPPIRLSGSRIVALALLLCALPAGASAPFTYRWRTPRVSVEWSEGNLGPDVAAGRRQVGHWKRLAHTLWSEKPGAPPLAMRVSLFGYYDYSAPGAQGQPVVLLRAGAREKVLPAPLDERRVLAALVEVRDGAVTPAASTLPPDQMTPRLSPDGQWLACVAWSEPGPEVRVVHDGRVLSFVPEGRAPLEDRLILTDPQWSADSRYVAWVQGGRVALAEPVSRTARFVSPAGRNVIAIDWSPHPTTPLLVRYDDESFHIADVRRARLFPVSEMLREAAPTGGFFWSPGGTKLLFPTQSRLVSTGLRGSGSGLRRVQEFVEGLFRRPQLPEVGADAERLALLDLVGRRLDTFPAGDGPLAMTEITGVNWSPDEDVTYAAGMATDAEGLFRLVRFPLRRGIAAKQLLATSQPLSAVGRRGGVNGPPPYLFMHDGSLLIVREGEPPLEHPYPASDFADLRLAPGPEGGYLGVESEAITDDEPGLRVLLETVARPDAAPGRVRLPVGLYAVTDLSGPNVAALRQLVRGGAVVDLDLDPNGDVAVAAVSQGGGVGGLLRIQDGPPSPVAVQPTEAVVITDQPFAVVRMDAALDLIPASSHGGSAAPLAAAGAALALLAGAFWLASRHRARRPRG